MSTRLLAVVLEGDESAALRGLGALAAVARAEQARVRIACVRRLPRPRLDRHDRVVADGDQEMTRIAAHLTETFGAATRHFDDLDIEIVVRFGGPSRELAIESDVFHPDRIAFFRTPAAPLHLRVQAWLLRRRATRRTAVRLVLFETMASGRATRSTRPMTVPS